MTVICAGLASDALAGCAGTTSASRSASPAEVAWADRVNLQAGDVPGYSDRFLARLSALEVTDGLFGRVIEQCAYGSTAADELAARSSPKFSGPHEHYEHGASVLTLLPISTVDSTVQFTPSATLASQVVADAVSTRGRECLAAPRALTEDTGAGVLGDAHAAAKAREEPFPKDIKVASTTILVDGAPVRVLQLTGRETEFAASREGPSLWSERWLMFTAGGATITLHDVGDPHAFPASEERRRLGLRLDRSRQ